MNMDSIKNGARNLDDGVYLYEYGSYGGYFIRLNETTPNFSGRYIVDQNGYNDHTNFNDEISSIRIIGDYKVQLFEHTNFGGSSVTYTSNTTSVGGFSSAKVFRWSEECNGDVVTYCGFEATDGFTGYPAKTHSPLGVVIDNYGVTWTEVNDARIWNRSDIPPEGIQCLALGINSSTSSCIIDSPGADGVGTVTFDYASFSSNADVDVSLSYRINGGGWIEVWTKHLDGNNPPWQTKPWPTATVIIDVAGDVDLLLKTDGAKGVVIDNFTATHSPIMFFDDFEAYDIENPSDFSVGGTPSGNWIPSSTASNATRTFDSPNFGSSRLWISSVNGASITSRPIDVLPNTGYTFSAMLACETSSSTREMQATYDLLIGQNSATATSVIGGPVTVTAHGDDWETPDSKIDHLFSDEFTTGTLNPGDNLFVVITRVAPIGSNSWFGVDDVMIRTVETSYMAIYSDPQVTWVNNDAWEASSGMSEWQLSRMYNLNVTNGINEIIDHVGNANFDGVIINGDLTEFGAQDEDLDDFEAWCVAPLNATVYPGLGNHDVENPLNDTGTRYTWTWNYAVDDIMHWFYDHIVPIADSIHNSSWAYSWDVGGVHYVQLNNHPGWDSGPFRAGGTLDGHNHHFYPSWEWLDADLQDAQSRGQKIVLNSHKRFITDTGPEVQNLLDDYKISAIFGGHIHGSFGHAQTKSNTAGTRQTKEFRSGATSYGTFLLTCTKGGTMYIWKMKVDRERDGQVMVVDPATESDLDVDFSDDPFNTDESAGPTYYSYTQTLY